jgi:hypothetical protein
MKTNRGGVKKKKIETKTEKTLAHRQREKKQVTKPIRENFKAIANPEKTP